MIFCSARVIGAVANPFERLQMKGSFIIFPHLPFRRCILVVFGWFYQEGVLVTTLISADGDYLDHDNFGFGVLSFVILRIDEEAC